MKWRNVSSSLILLIEITFLYLVFLPFYMTAGTVPPVFPLLIILVCAYYLNHVLLKKWNSKKVGFITIPVIAVLAFIVGFYYIVAILLAGYLFWRIVATIEGETEAWHLFFTTLIVGVVFYLHFFSLENNYLFLLLVVIQFLLVISLKSFQSPVSVEFTHRDRHSFIGWNFSVLFILVVITAIGWAVYAFFVHIILYVMQVIVFLYTLLSIPVFYIIELFVRENEVMEEGERAESLQEGLEDDASQLLEILPHFGWVEMVGSLLLWGIFLTIAVSFTLRVLKKRRAVRFQSENTIVYDGDNDVEELNNTSSFWRRKKPKHEVRKLLLGLELTARKKGIGRKQGQTLEEWLLHLPLHDDEHKREIINTYTKVRYGHKHVSKEEQKQYAQHILAVKQQWKDIL
ncbi:DUF4129 domain-containing protein [Alkalihalobacterium bogoriense]|uniref:DUF4129 domain-containing protein n=1 Tax=Alkalihalobacterium bogoriense TaxID=246272 RepID=UPI000478B1A3|nr:DUF4129 domain-containing protein [Alkalihalobacterium bogoriense]